MLVDIFFLLALSFWCICVYKNINIEYFDWKSSLSGYFTAIFVVLFVISLVGCLICTYLCKADRQIISTKYLAEYEEGAIQDLTKYIYINRNTVYFYEKDAKEKFQYVEGNDVIFCKNMESVFESMYVTKDFSLEENIFITEDETVEVPVLNEITVVHSNPLLYWLSDDFFREHKIFYKPYYQFVIPPDSVLTK